MKYEIMQARPFPNASFEMKRCGELYLWWDHVMELDGCTYTMGNHCFWAAVKSLIFEGDLKKEKTAGKQIALSETLGWEQMFPACCARPLENQRAGFCL